MFAVVRNLYDFSVGTPREGLIVAKGIKDEAASRLPNRLVGKRVVAMKAINIKISDEAYARLREVMPRAFSEYPDVSPRELQPGSILADYVEGVLNPEHEVTKGSLLG